MKYNSGVVKYYVVLVLRIFAKNSGFNTAASKNSDIYLLRY